MRTVTLTIHGMTCVSCQNRIERKLRSTRGIAQAKVSYGAGTAQVTYHEQVISLEDISSIIQRLGYQVTRATRSKTADIIRALGAVMLLLAAFLLLNWLGALNLFNAFPQAREGTGYGMLFVIGLLTSLHCVAMCGGINLSQAIPQPAGEGGNSKLTALTPSLLYNLGRVLSYTVIGGIVGAIGSVVSLPGAMKGLVQLMAGIFMVIMGLNMLGLFPWLRKLTPRMPKVFASRIQGRKISKSPLYVGLLNGLMPCGPLQAMQLYALSTGSPVKGALSMLLFSLGTVPLMFGLGAVSSLLSRKFTRRMMTAAAALVVVLGLSMFSNGLSLSGIPLPFANVGTYYSVAKVSDDVQTVKTKLHPGKYEPITVQKGIPVRWIIQAEEKDINGCNNEIFIPKFNIQKKLAAGDNVIEFTPTESGTFPYTCWMGMIRSQISVVEDIRKA